MRSLLICDDVPSAAYGTGQRLLLLREALASLGECRVLFLGPGRPEQLSEVDFTAPKPVGHDASRWRWIWRKLAMSDYRVDKRYRQKLAALRFSYPFDIAVCSFLRTAPVAPIGEVPCFIDVDALPSPQSSFDRLLWPLTRAAIRRRVKQFDGHFFIKHGDRTRLGGNLASTLLPGFSTTVRLGPPCPRERRVLFVAPQGWPPNREAVQRLLHHNVPQQLAAMGYSLRLVGAGTDALPDVPGLARVGFVPSVADEYAAAELVICPITKGDGAVIKLAEAVQYGCATLASRHAASGYETILQADRDVAVYDDNAPIMPAIRRLLDDPAKLAALRVSAAHVARSSLDPEQVKAIVVRTITSHLGVEHGSAVSL